MALDAKWYDNVTGPFKDNNVDAIHAVNLRDFATELAAAIAAAATAVGSGSLVPQGAYSAGTTYNPKDVVTSAGSAYYLGGSVTQIGVAPPGGAWVLLVAAGAAGSVTYGTTGGTAAQGNDARLSDTRVPTDGSVTDAKVAGSAAIAPSKIAGTAVVTADARLSDTRVPTASSIVDAMIASTLSPNKVTGVAVTGTVDNSKMGSHAAASVIGNAGAGAGAVTDLTMTVLANMLAVALQASQVAAQSASGVLGPTVQTALDRHEARITAVETFN